jgi:hypothetical protein
MSWLDLIDDQRARRLARHVGRTARATVGAAQEHLDTFARQAEHLAEDAIQPRRLADTVAANARTARRLAREHFDALAHDAGDLASDTTRQLARYGRQEGAILAAAAARQVGRAKTAVKADPMPYVVGAVGLVLLTSLLRGRKLRR